MAQNSGMKYLSRRQKLEVYYSSAMSPGCFTSPWFLIPIFVCSEGKLFEDLYVCAVASKRCWFCIHSCSGKTVIVPRASTMTHTGIMKLEYQGYVTLNFLSSHMEQGSHNEQHESRDVIGNCLYGRALGCLLFPFSLAVTVTLVAHTASL